MDTQNSELLMLKGKPIIVYGVGRIGKIIINGLKYLQLNVIGAAVTKLSNNDLENVDGIKIKPIEEWQEYSEKAVILIATAEKYHKQIYENCKGYGFKNILPMSRGMNKEIFYSFLKEFGREHNFSMDSDYIALCDGKYINPFFVGASDKLDSIGYTVELFDFIIPSFYNEYSMVTEGLYELGDVKLVAGDIVFDLGANVGLFSVYASSKRCTSYSFEPTAELQKILQHHNELNENIHIVPYAVADRCGSAKLYIDSSDYECNTLFGQDNGKLVSVSVQQITIDEFVKSQKIDKVDFIKADIEGAERLMLKGAQETLRTFAPKLALCTYHFPDDKEVLTDLILKANPNYIIEYKWQKLYAHI